MAASHLGWASVCGLVASLAAGQQQPSIVCPASDGDPASLAGLDRAGMWLDTSPGATAAEPPRAWVVEVRGAGCGDPCEAQRQGLRRVENRLRALRFRFLTIETGGANPDPASPGPAAGDAWPTLADPERLCRLPAPSVFVIDRQGRAPYVRRGLLDEESLASALVRVR